MSHLCEHKWIWVQERDEYECPKCHASLTRREMLHKSKPILRFEK